MAYKTTVEVSITLELAGKHNKEDKIDIHQFIKKKRKIDSLKINNIKVLNVKNLGKDQSKSKKIKNLNLFKKIILEILKRKVCGDQIRISGSMPNKWSPINKKAHIEIEYASSPSTYILLSCYDDKIVMHKGYRVNSHSEQTFCLSDPDSLNDLGEEICKRLNIKTGE